MNIDRLRACYASMQKTAGRREPFQFPVGATLTGAGVGGAAGAAFRQWQLAQPGVLYNTPGAVGYTLAGAGKGALIGGGTLALLGSMIRANKYFQNN